MHNTSIASDTNESFLERASEELGANCGIDYTVDTIDSLLWATVAGAIKESRIILKLAYYHPDGKQYTFGITFNNRQPLFEELEITDSYWQQG